MTRRVSYFFPSMKTGRSHVGCLSITCAGGTIQRRRRFIKTRETSLGDYFGRQFGAGFMPQRRRWPELGPGRAPTRWRAAVLPVPLNFLSQSRWKQARKRGREGRSEGTVWRRCSIYLRSILSVQSEASPSCCRPSLYLTSDCERTPVTVAAHVWMRV